MINDFILRLQCPEYKRGVVCVLCIDMAVIYNVFMHSNSERLIWINKLHENNFELIIVFV